MRILLFTPLYPQPSKKHLFNDTFAVHYIAKELVKLNHEVLVVHLYFHSIKEIFKTHRIQNSDLVECPPLEGVNIMLIERQLYLPKINFVNFFRGKSLRNKIELFLSRVNQNTYPDVILCHFPTFFRGIVEKLNIDVPKIAILHDSDIRAIKNERFKSPYFQKLFNRYDGFGYRSTKIKDTFKKYVNVCRLDFILYSSIDEHILINKEEIERKIQQQEKNKTYKIMYAGKLKKLKNVDIILYALAKLKSSIKYEFSIIGDGEDFWKLKNLAKVIGIENEVHFLGKLSRQDTLAIMRLSDIFIMVSSPETFGLVYLEAMSQGCITIGTKNEGIDGLIVNEENGFLVNKKDVHSLVHILEKIEQMDLDDKIALLSNSLDTISKLTDEIVARKYSNRIEEIISLCKQ